MKYEFTSENYFREMLEDGEQWHTDKISHQNCYRIELADDEHLIFTRNGKTSKPIPIVCDPGWAWSLRKTHIKSNRSAEGLFKTLSAPFWFSAACNFCDYYCLGTKGGKIACKHFIVCSSDGNSIEYTQEVAEEQARSSSALREIAAAHGYKFYGSYEA